MERIRYADDDIEVRLGDHVTYKSLFFWRDWKPGRVTYVPGLSPLRPGMERDGHKWVGAVGDDGTYRGFLIDPATSRAQATLRFQGRADASET